MSYRIRRIDPFWIAHPVVIAAAVVGMLLALGGYAKNNIALSIIGGVSMAGGVLAATKPAVSGVLGSLGFFGGLITFVILPNPQLADSPLFWKLVSTLFFALLYMVLMDALVLLVSALYNFFGNSVNLGGIHLDIEEDDEAVEEPAA
ncbi:MAG: hypothetical protein COB53_00690 [Elusimicrobia bacterium]|nr:MAG: hypothetical protein COB53_00690 [Elusimicrobiota bacterium]